MLESSSFTKDHKYCQLLSLKWQAHLASLLKSYLQNTQILISIVCQSFFQIKMMLSGKKTSYIVAQQPDKCLSWRQPLNLGVQQKPFSVLPIYHTECTQWLRFNTIIFTASRTLLSEKNLLLHSRGRNIVVTRTVVAKVLSHQCKCQHREEGKSHIGDILVTCWVP